MNTLYKWTIEKKGWVCYLMGGWIMTIKMINAQLFNTLYLLGQRLDYMWSS